MDSNSRITPLIGIVGVCASGKTTLIRRLTKMGYRCRHIAQEHSYVPTMWFRITHPDFLIYLQVEYEETIRRKQLDWTMGEYNEQLFRLRDAYAHANVVIDTSRLTLDETINAIVTQLEKAGIQPPSPSPERP